MSTHSRKYAIISDLHSNLEAVSNVFADIRSQGIEDVVCLGDVVGYEQGEERSPQFGLAYLRLARKLEPGFVITIEPGIYFIPALIDRWESDGMHREFICYDRLAAYRDFGGIRIEDDVLITADGSRVLGPPIPKAVDEVESAMES